MWWLVFLQFTVVKALEPSIQVTEDNLHGLLSAPERVLLLGTESDVRDTSEKNIAIVHPIIYRNSNKFLTRKKRTISSRQTKEQYNNNNVENVHRVVLETTKSFGKIFDLKLTPSPPLLDPNVIFLSQWSNRTTLIPNNFVETNCYFRGERAALSLCDGIRGIITSEDNHFYTIHPLPIRFQESKKNPHVIVKRSIPKSFDSFSSKCIHKNHNKDMKQHDENIKEWSKHHRRKISDNLETNQNYTSTAYKNLANNLANRNISNLYYKSYNNILKTDINFDSNKVISQQDSDLFINNENKINDINETNSNKSNLLKNIFTTNNYFLNETNVEDIKTSLLKNNSQNNDRKKYSNVRLNLNNDHMLENLFEKESVENSFVEFKSNNNGYISINGPQIYSQEENISSRRGKRTKRAAPAAGVPVHVETAVFVDKDLFQHMQANYPSDTEREVVRFVLAMINAVQLLYHDPSLGRPVNFALKRLEVLHDDASATAPGFGPLRRSHDIDRFLGAFCSWQRARNPSRDSDPAHWDHALILTGLDLYVVSKRGKISSQVVGLAPVAGMCTATSSCTVNEGRHFESVYVVAHEIGHNLGMRHDGPLADNDCDPSSFIMSPTLGSGKITWSDCSKRYLQMFLETTQSQCLLDHGSSAGQLDHSAEGALPGERFDANQQCMLKYGRGSKHSLHQPLDDICRDLHCQRDRYTWTSHPALEGTTCGPNMWCRGGRCIGRSNLALRAYSGVSVSSAKVHGGWSAWQTINDCASGCLYGEEGRLRAGSTGVVLAARRCNSPRPENGGRRCEGPTRRYQACNAMQCLNVPRMTISEFADQICGRAREVDTDLTGSGLQRLSSDPEEACMVWCHKRGGGSKTRGWTFPDGTVCQKRQRRFGKPTYCINGRCQEFSCQNQNEDAEFLTLPELCPDVSWRNNPRRRDNNVPVRWISASGCHSHCMAPGTGIRLVITKNKPQRSSIQLCQPDKNSCGRLKTPFQHATAVCTKYKERVRRLSGLGMQISPALEDPDRPCRVACQDENVSHRFYLVNGEEGWFPFGTDCTRGSTEKRAYCISGKCLEFGADDTPLSESEFTLPLLSRTKRSLQRNITRVMATLQQHELDQIVSRLNLTFTDSNISHGRPISQHQDFEIDLKNPIHIPMEFPMDMFPHNYYRDYYNNVYV